MKDIRLIELQDGKIGLFTRPQGIIGGKGKIGFTIINSLEDINETVISSAPLIPNQFDNNNSWGGVNAAYLLNNETIGVLGHYAYENKHGKHYSAITFTVNLKKGDVSTMKTIARRSDFPPGTSKTKQLWDIVFPGGLIKNADGSATLYAGLSDKESGLLIIDYPWNL